MNLQEIIARFTLQRQLANDPQTKSAAFLGTIDGQPAILKLEKTPIDESTPNIAALITKCNVLQQNDIYSWAQAHVDEEYGAKLDLIWPCTETHIRKYDTQKYHMVTETAEMYHKYVVPYIKTQQGDRIKWVYNILYDGKESETFVYHDKDPKFGFVLLPDMKWDRTNLDALYLTCIVNRKDIASVRDLTGADVPWLEDLKALIVMATRAKYSVAADQLRVFVHYHPSYYHFHIHVVNVAHQGLGYGITVGKAIMLDDIITVLKVKPDFYATEPLTTIMGENHGLWKIEGYREAHYAQFIS
ncbi:hypothetical protein DIURU_002884 [Diutina rugosa]|uniref:HIT domain-containing protein n=1 Tax=Diutina rugosa TaxID=5481 RepID=A0A642UNT7_DIURU|nr:uncharacterized protein DIURU_002884 [Diutina rugosa]KAA8902430.1 hypothetical protein DIURU_002884 [Diutina rugosa]